MLIWARRTKTAEIANVAGPRPGGLAVSYASELTRWNVETSIMATGLKRLERVKGNYATAQ